MEWIAVHFPFLCHLHVCINANAMNDSWPWYWKRWQGELGGNGQSVRQQKQHPQKTQMDEGHLCISGEWFLRIFPSSCGWIKILVHFGNDSTRHQLPKLDGRRHHQERRCLSVEGEGKLEGRVFWRNFLLMNGDTISAFGDCPVIDDSAKTHTKIHPRHSNMATEIVRKSNFNYTKFIVVCCKVSVVCDIIKYWR